MRLFLRSFEFSARFRSKVKGIKPYNLKTFPISESRESLLTLPSVGNDERANGEPSLHGLS